MHIVERRSPITSVNNFKRKGSALQKNGLHFIFNNNLDRQERFLFRPLIDEKRRSPMNKRLEKPLLNETEKKLVTEPSVLEDI